MRVLKAPWLPLLIVLAFIVAACAPPAAPTPTPTKAPPAAAPTTAAPKTEATKPAEKPAATPTTATSKPAGAPIKIGLIQSLTGSLANVGKDNQDGFDLYLEKIGGTIAGRKIERVVEDDEGKADVGLTKIRKLGESDKASIV